MARPEERKAARAMDEGFDVTFGRDIRDLSMWLATPKQVIRERFGLQKEVLVLYSRHPNTDARVLTATHNILESPEFEQRLDRGLSLLVHCGDPQGTADLVRNHLDPTFVPIPSSELTDPRRGPLFLRSKIAAAVSSIDLFGMSAPITSDRYFFERDKIVQALLQRTLARRENAGLFGLRKTGKTSVLRAFQRRMAGRQLLSDTSIAQIPGFIRPAGGRHCNSSLAA